MAQALVLAKEAGDARVIGLVCEQLGMSWSACDDPDHLCSQVSEATTVAICTEEALHDAVAPLTRCLRQQPPWSDLPLIVLTFARSRQRLDMRWQAFEPLGNVTLLERPLRVETLKAALLSAWRARERQYLMREHLRELSTAAQGLEDKVRQRTGELESAIIELRQAEQALVQAQRLEAVGQLTGGVAHDFNNLLQVIVASLALLERGGSLSPVQQKAAEAIGRSARRGALLSQQLLAFAARQRLEAVAVDLTEQLRGMRPLLEHSLRGDIELRIDLAPGLWPVLVDPTQLEVALLNLAINARDAMSGGGVLTIAAFNEAASKPGATDRVCISVTDTGHGMSEEVAAQAFEPFFSTKGPGHGTGLGLSQVHGFARQSGGEAALRSTSPTGSTFELRVPRAVTAPTAGTPEQPSAPAAVPLAPELTVLVVEDDDDVAQATCALLSQLGYRTKRAASADQALAMPLANVGLVFTDVLMPGSMDGIALAEELSRRMPGLPVLLTSGYVGVPDRVARAGFTLLRKPHDSEQLRQAIGMALSKNRQA